MWPMRSYHTDYTLNVTNELLSHPDLFCYNRKTVVDDDDIEFRFNNASAYKSHLHQNGILTWFGIETAIMVKSYMHENIKPEQI